MPEITVTIEWDWPDEPLWLNPFNVQSALSAYCPITAFVVTEKPDTATADDTLEGVLRKLLKACRMARRYLTDDDARNDMSDVGYGRYDDVCDALRDAIAKAEGRDA